MVTPVPCSFYDTLGGCGAAKHFVTSSGPSATGSFHSEWPLTENHRDSSRTGAADTCAGHLLSSGQEGAHGRGTKRTLLTNSDSGTEATLQGSLAEPPWAEDPASLWLVSLIRNTKVTPGHRLSRAPGTATPAGGLCPCACSYGDSAARTLPGAFPCVAQ